MPDKIPSSLLAVTRARHRAMVKCGFGAGVTQMNGEMTKSDRRSQWTPPPRPEWVARMNEEGSYLDLKEVIPIESRSLLDSAMRNTGLSDFGADDWREPFEILVRALDTEAQLNLMGRLMTRSDLLMFLEGHLWIEHWYRKHPEIDDEQIVAPLLLTGQGRSGTSALQNLMSADPAHGTTRAWEVLLPGPNPPETATYADDPRIETAHRRSIQWSQVTPEMGGMHDWSGWRPTENIHLQCLSFQSPVWLNILGQVPSYNEYMSGRSLVPAFEYEKRALKYLQWRNPRDRWVLKTPVYLDMIPFALAVYPDALFVWIHRDPVQTTASAAAMAGVVNLIRSDRGYVGSELDGTLGNLEAYANAEMSAATFDRVIGWLEDGTLPADQLCNVQYRDFIKDPVGLVRQIYEYFGIEASEDRFNAMADWMASDRKNRSQKHSYSRGSDKQVAHERRVFARYQDYFKVPSEDG
jgi:hypothetical protein